MIKQEDILFDDAENINAQEEDEAPQTANTMEEVCFLISEPAKRLDSFLAEKLDDISRSGVQKLIKEKNVLVNGKNAKASQALLTNNTVLVKIPKTKIFNLIPQNISLDIIYEDDDVIVINKPYGMVVHPAAGNYDKTLVNALMWHCEHLSSINGEMRPGIVHRIDKETSGLIIAAKNDTAHYGLLEEWQTKEVSRYYMALLHGRMVEPGGTIDAPIGRHPMDRKKMSVLPAKGKNAVTHYKVLERFSKYTLIEANLDTGRTHQIRVHMAYFKHPVVGDIIYGPKKWQKISGYPENTGHFLHSARMTFRQPITNQIITCTAPLPAEFSGFLDKLRNEDQ